MDNKQVRDAVQEEHSHGGAARGASLANIKKIIQSLVEWTPTPLLLHTRAGHKPIIYQLPKDTMVTWVTSARMLISLDDDNRGIVEREAFVQKILRSGLKNQDTGSAVTKAEVDQQIDYCRDRQFPYIEEDKKGFIKATERVNSEKAFLEKIQA